MGRPSFQRHRCSIEELMTRIPDVDIKCRRGLRWVIISEAYYDIVAEEAPTVVARSHGTEEKARLGPE